MGEVFGADAVIAVNDSSAGDLALSHYLAPADSLGVMTTVFVLKLW